MDNPQEEQQEPVDNQAEEGAEQQAPDESSVKELIMGIHNNMLKFKELLQGEPSVPDEAKAKLDQIIGEYRNFVVSLGQNKAPQEAPPEAPAEAAPAPSAPAPAQKGRMPMSGGKGAVPAL